VELRESVAFQSQSISENQLLTPRPTPLLFSLSLKSAFTAYPTLLSEDSKKGENLDQALLVPKIEDNNCE